MSTRDKIETVRKKQFSSNLFLFFTYQLLHYKQLHILTLHILALLHYYYIYNLHNLHICIFALF